MQQTLERLSITKEELAHILAEFYIDNKKDLSKAKNFLLEKDVLKVKFIIRNFIENCDLFDFLILKAKASDIFDKLTMGNIDNLIEDVEDLIDSFESFIPRLNSDLRFSVKESISVLN